MLKDFFRIMNNKLCVMINILVYFKFVILSFFCLGLFLSGIFDFSIKLFDLDLLVKY